MNKEAQPPRENVSGLSGSEQQRPDQQEQGEVLAGIPIQKFDRPRFRSDPTMQEAPGGDETAQNVFHALDRKSAEQKSAPN